MKKTILLSLLITSFAVLTNAQETATSSSGGKKLYVGLAGNYYISTDQHLGGKFLVEYFLTEKLSLEGSYSFGYSGSKVKYDYKYVPGNPNAVSVGEVTTNNYLHIGGLMANYYFIGGTSSTFSVFAGLGLSYNALRSTEFTRDNSLYTWKGLYLTSQVGADYLLGPGKIFASTGFSPRLALFGGSPDNEIFEYVFNAALGYKIGF